MLKNKYVIVILYRIHTQQTGGQHNSVMLLKEHEWQFKLVPNWVMIITSQDVIVFSILIHCVLVRSVTNICNEFRHQICHTMAELCHWIHDLGPYYPVQHNSQPQRQLSFLTAIYKVTLHKANFFLLFIVLHVMGIWFVVFTTVESMFCFIKMPTFVNLC